MSHEHMMNPTGVMARVSTAERQEISATHLTVWQGMWMRNLAFLISHFMPDLVISTIWLVG